MYTGWISFPILRLNSPSCLRTEFADLWTLNGNIILTGAFLSSQVCLDLTSPETFAVTKPPLTLTATVKRILPKDIADSVVQKGSRLAHLYGLPKTHKKQLAMRPILSATGTYNYKLAKWLDETLKPLSINDHTVSDIFGFVDELQNLQVDAHSILVSYDVSSLFTNVPVDETIEILAEKAFKDVRANCFCASLLRTQIHTPRHTRARALSNKMRDDRAKGHCYSFAWI